MKKLKSCYLLIAFVAVMCPTAKVMAQNNSNPPPNDGIYDVQHDTVKVLSGVDRIEIYPYPAKNKSASITLIHGKNKVEEINLGAVGNYEVTYTHFKNPNSFVFQITPNAKVADDPYFRFVIGKKLYVVNLYQCGSLYCNGKKATIKVDKGEYYSILVIKWTLLFLCKEVT